MDTKIREFTQMDTWKESHKLVLNIYKISENFPKKEIFILTSQILRAAISLTSNISEGFGRRFLAEKAHFYEIAEGSLCEIKNQIILAKDLNYIDQNEYKKLEDLTVSVSKLLYKLIHKTREDMKTKRTY